MIKPAHFDFSFQNVQQNINAWASSASAYSSGMNANYTTLIISKTNCKLIWEVGSKANFKCNAQVYVDEKSGTYIKTNVLKKLRGDKNIGENPRCQNILSKGLDYEGFLKDL